VVVNGQTKTLIGTTETWLRINAVYNVSPQSVAGVIYVYEDDTIDAGVPDTASKVKAQINDGHNVTLMSHYCTPANTYGYFLQGYAVIGNRVSANVQVELRSSLLGTAFRTNTLTAVNNNSPFKLDLDLPVLIPPRTDIKFTALSGANGVSISCGYEILLIRSDMMKF
jgi:hypothetical protein